MHLLSCLVFILPFCCCLFVCVVSLHCRVAFAVLCGVVACCAVWCVVWYRIVSCRIMSCRVTLRCGVSCYVVLCSVMLWIYGCCKVVKCIYHQVLVSCVENRKWQNKIVPNQQIYYVNWYKNILKYNNKYFKYKDMSKTFLRRIFWKWPKFVSVEKLQCKILLMFDLVLYVIIRLGDWIRKD